MNLPQPSEDQNCSSEGWRWTVWRGQDGKLWAAGPVAPEPDEPVDVMPVSEAQAELEKVKGELEAARRELGEIATATDYASAEGKEAGYSLAENVIDLLEIREGEREAAIEHAQAAEARAEHYQSGVRGEIKTLRGLASSDVIPRPSRFHIAATADQLQDLLDSEPKDRCPHGLKEDCEFCAQVSQKQGEVGVGAGSSSSVASTRVGQAATDAADGNPPASVDSNLNQGGDADAPSGRNDHRPEESAVVARAAVEGGGGPETSECSSCGEDDHIAVGPCPKSKRPCGHHCNCSWVHCHCHWCGREFGEAAPQPSDTTELAPDQGGRKESAGELRSGVEGEAPEKFTFEDWRAVDSAMAFALEYSSEERTDKARLEELRPLVQDAFGQLDRSTQPSLQGLIEELEKQGEREPENADSKAGMYLRGYAKACKDAAQLLRDSEVGK